MYVHIKLLLIRMNVSKQVMMANKTLRQNRYTGNKTVEILRMGQGGWFMRVVHSQFCIHQESGRLATPLTDGFWNYSAKFYWLYRTNREPDQTRNFKNKKIYT